MVNSGLSPPRSEPSAPEPPPSTAWPQYRHQHRSCPDGSRILAPGACPLLDPAARRCSGQHPAGDCASCPLTSSEGSPSGPGRSSSATQAVPAATSTSPLPRDHRFADSACAAFIASPRKVLHVFTYFHAHTHADRLTNASTCLYSLGRAPFNRHARADCRSPVHPTSHACRGANLPPQQSFTSSHTFTHALTHAYMGAHSDTPSRPLVLASPLSSFGASSTTFLLLTLHCFPLSHLAPSALTLTPSPSRSTHLAFVGQYVHSLLCAYISAYVNPHAFPYAHSGVRPRPRISQLPYSQLTTRTTRRPSPITPTPACLTRHSTACRRASVCKDSGADVPPGVTSHSRHRVRRSKRTNIYA